VIPRSLCGLSEEFCSGVYAAIDVSAMQIKYFQDTYTLHIEFRACEVAETKDLDENTLLDLDNNDQICAITIERAEIPNFSYEQITP
jgi:uncharacterized protein YuzE